MAIVIRRFEEWDSGSFSGRRVLSDHAAVVDGLPARVQEVEITERTSQGHRCFSQGATPRCATVSGGYTTRETAKHAKTITSAIGATKVMICSLMGDSRDKR